MTDDDLDNIERLIDEGSPPPGPWWYTEKIRTLLEEVRLLRALLATFEGNNTGNQG